ncbi:hypothetical protein GJ744_000930 [Endocarpon pusillum]|uniref:Uncharacterized protein n=1 Tax=Endocarpon pusillum TaxID=364733 RepID=A0A8H7AQW4_9EURO|nr:hypothetical protein GJ744_000930 [Endocarpon pusillum]
MSCVMDWFEPYHELAYANTVAILRCNSLGVFGQRVYDCEVGHSVGEVNQGQPAG